MFLQTYATQKDGPGAELFAHYRIMTIDWSRKINQYHEHSLSDQQPRVSFLHCEELRLFVDKLEEKIHPPAYAPVKTSCNSILVINTKVKVLNYFKRITE